MAGTGPLAFVTVSLLIIMTPGQDTLLTLRNTLNGGRVAGWLTAMGVVGGQLTWTLAASAGLSAALNAFPSAFTAIRVAGAIYLMIIGSQSLRAAVDRRRVAVTRFEPDVASKRAGFVRQGLLSNLGNPKMMLFFTGLLPQFAAAGNASDFVMLGLTFCFLTLSWLCLYAAAVAKLGALFERATFWRTLEGVTGVGLVALGLRVATDAAS